jgi:hypothetical protein
MITGRVLGAIKKEEVNLVKTVISANGDVNGIFKSTSSIEGNGMEIEFLLIPTAYTDGTLKLKSIQFSNDGTNSAKEILVADLDQHIANKNCSLTGADAVDGEKISVVGDLNKVKALNYHWNVNGYKYIRPVYVASDITTGMEVIGLIEMTQKQIPASNS